MEKPRAFGEANRSCREPHVNIECKHVSAVGTTNAQARNDAREARIGKWLFLRVLGNHIQHPYSRPDRQFPDDLGAVPTATQTEESDALPAELSRSGPGRLPTRLHSVRFAPSDVERVPSPGHQSLPLDRLHQRLHRTRGYRNARHHVGADASEHHSASAGVRGSLERAIRGSHAGGDLVVRLRSRRPACVWLESVRDCRVGHQLPSRLDFAGRPRRRVHRLLAGFRLFYPPFPDVLHFHWDNPVSLV